MNTSPPPLRGTALLVAAVNQIIRHQETWDQKGWHSECGTKHCVAGWMQVLGGRKPSAEFAREDATALGGLSYVEACLLFSSQAKLGHLHAGASAKAAGRRIVDDAGWTTILPTPTDQIAPIEYVEGSVA